MKEKSKLKSRPPAKTTNLESFIEGAATHTKPEVPPEHHEPYPWEDPRVREDVIKMFNLRLPEPYLLKLKYIAEHTPDSMQTFCQKVLLPAIDKKIEEILE